MPLIFGVVIEGPSLFRSCSILLIKQKPSDPASGFLRDGQLETIRSSRDEDALHVVMSPCNLILCYCEMLHQEVSLSKSCLALGCKGLNSTQNLTKFKDDDLDKEKCSSLSLNFYLGL